MFFVDIMGQFIPPVHFCPRGQAYLFEEERNAASDLKITHHEVLQTDYLLCLAEICHKALLVHAAVEVSSPALTVASPSYQHVPEFASFEKHLKTFHEALYQRTAPLKGNFVFFQIVEKSNIPHESGCEGLLVLQSKGEGEVVFI